MRPRFFLPFGIPLSSLYAGQLCQRPVLGRPTGRPFGWPPVVLALVRYRLVFGHAISGAAMSPDRRRTCHPALQRLRTFFLYSNFILHSRRCAALAGRGQNACGLRSAITFDRTVRHQLGIDWGDRGSEAFADMSASLYITLG